MTLNLLDHFLLTQLFTFMLLFTRLGSAIMLFPAFGDMHVSARIRLLFALSVSVLLTPLLESHFPPAPASPLALGVMIITESTIGLAIGLLVRIILSAVHVAGTIIAFQSSLSSASMFDPNSGGQSSLISNMLVVMTTLLFLVLDFHHILLNGMVTSYELFPAGSLPSMGDFSELTTRAASDAFTMGLQLASPHVAYGLIFYLAGGVMGRLMPQFQVFFVMMGAQIMIAFFLLIAVLSTLIYVYMDHVNESLQSLFVG